MRSFLFLIAVLTAPAQVKFSDIVAGNGADWLTYAGDYRAHGLSPLRQITPENAKNLQAKWTFQVPKANGLRTRPLVHAGVLYATTSHALYALDARSGRLIWQYVEPPPAKDAVNRGAAILGDKVYFATADCYLVALDRRSGGVYWRSRFGQTEDGLFSSAAPLAIDGKIIVGVGGGDTGMRGYVAALDAENGKELWRTYTIPARGEKGSETWGNYIEYGGGATWLSGTYDAESNTLYWTTGNPWPDFYGGDRKGDNLYTCSLLALDAATGKMKWYFQFTPHDWHDWDAQSWPVLVDANYQGKPRKLVFHANRNGFLYVLDRSTGQYLRSNKIIDLLDWASGIDANGRPLEIPGKNPTPEGNRICPGVQGATNWYSQSWNPSLGLLSIIAFEQCDIFTSSSKEPEPKKSFSGGGAGPKPKDKGSFYVRAFNPLTGERKWEYKMTGNGNMWSGLTGTVTGVLFAGDDDGHLLALDARTGKHLWHHQLGEPLFASPITYLVDGKQYVSIASASAIHTFGLFEPVESVPPAIRKIQ